MTDPVEPTTPEEPINPYLAHVKHITMERIVSHMNGVGSNIKSRYPVLEQDTWTIQKIEAEAVLPLVEPEPGAVLAAAPLLTKVCVWHYGEADDATRAEQVLAKAAIAVGLSAFFLEVAAFVNGLRARAADRIADAATENEVYEIESETQSELGAFRSQFGV